MRQSAMFSTVLMFASLFAVLLYPGESRSAQVSLTACQCLQVPGQTMRLTMTLSNPGSNPAALLVAMHTPDDQWYFFSPAGLLVAPTWLDVPASAPAATVELLNLQLTPESLPFGEVPLVGPFRYEFVALMYDAVTGQPLAPVAATWIDFLPHPSPGFPTSAGTLHLLPHQHDDLAWLEREEVYLPLVADYIRDSILETQRAPEYRFVLATQKPALESFRERYPELVAQLRTLIDTGVAGLGGGQQVQADLNLVSGESLVRQVIHGQQYLEQSWGRRASVFWHIDAFGHSLQMPQIARKSGFSRYVFARGLSDAALEQGSEFIWRAPDGSEVTAHFMPQMYQAGREIGTAPQNDAQMAELHARLARTALSGALLGPVGADVGENVFGPFLPEAVAAWNVQQAAGVTARISTAEDFFDDLDAQAPTLPVRDSVEFQEQPEGGPIFPGVYASRIEIKKTNSRLEQLLLDTEKLASIASLEGYTYPQQPLREAAEQIATNQFHDYLPGSGVDEIYDDADEVINDYGDRAAAAQTTLLAEHSAAISFLTAQIDTTLSNETPLGAIVVFNTQAWARRDLVSLPVTGIAAQSPLRLLRADGVELPYQLLPGVDGATELVFLADIAGLGYTTFYLLAGIPQVSPTETVVEVGSPHTVALGNYSVAVDAQGFVSQITSAVDGAVLLSGAEHPGGDLHWQDERYGNAYEYDPLAGNPGRLSDQPQAPVVLSGPVLSRMLAVDTLLNQSLALREVRFIPDLDRMDFSTTLYWSDLNRNVFVRFGFDTPSDAIITEGVPYGHVVRPNGHYPALRWADFGNAQRGVSVLNRGLFGHRFSEDSGKRVLDITLLRSMDRAVFGDLPSEAMKAHGVHRADYALLPRASTWNQRSTVRRAWEYNAPLIAQQVAIQSGSLPASRTYLRLEAPSNAVLSVMQRDGADIVLRIYETDATAGQHVLTLASMQASGVVQTDLLGGSALSLPGTSTVNLDLAAQEILTLRLKDVTHTP